MTVSTSDIVIRPTSKARASGWVAIVLLFLSASVLPLNDYSQGWWNGGTRGVLLAVILLFVMVPSAFQKIIISGNTIKFVRIFRGCKELTLDQVGKTYLLFNTAFSKVRSQQIFAFPPVNLDEWQIVARRNEAHDTYRQSSFFG